jgi:hypothetical protein
LVRETSEHIIKYNVQEKDMIQNCRKKFSPFGLISKKLLGSIALKQQ